MTQTEEKRLAAILEKYPELDKERAEFLVRSGLTFNDKAYAKFLEQKDNDIDWYYPKGAAFNDEEETTEQSTENTTENNTENTDNHDDNQNDNQNDNQSNDDNQNDNQSNDDNQNSSVEPIQEPVDDSSDSDND